MRAPDAYTESFGDRGSKYDQAMRRCRDSRRQEFMAVVNELAPNDSGLLLDVPAGGGYLRDYLPSRFTHYPHEPVGSFTGQVDTGRDIGLLPLPLPDSSAGAVVSVAGVHHFRDKAPLYRDMVRVAMPGARLVLADVHRLSPVAAFLDGYIDAVISTGHRGFYLGDDTVEALQNSGWLVHSAERKSYHWTFESERQMVEFCHLLFDITHDDLEQTRRCIEQELGVDRLSGGRIGMRWELFVITAEKQATA